MKSVIFPRDMMTPNEDSQTDIPHTIRFEKKKIKSKFALSHFISTNLGKQFHLQPRRQSIEQEVS